jgi:serine/threonine protein phosphatase PrpC
MRSSPGARSDGKGQTRLAPDRGHPLQCRWMDAAAKLLTEQDMSEGELGRFATGKAVVYSTRCPGKESVNEDAAALIPVSARAGVLAVADGLGGQPGGATAASIAIHALRACVGRAGSEPGALRTAILDGFEAANREVLALGIGAATTLVAVEVDGTTLRPYHVGDSAIVVVGQRGRMKLQTISHSPVGYAVEAGVLDESEAMHHEDRHLVSNMIGATDMRIEVGSPLQLARRDSLLLATDGLLDNLSSQEITELVRRGPLGDVSRRLVEAAGRRMKGPNGGHPSKPDDLTFIVFRLDPGPV